MRILAFVAALVVAAPAYAQQQGSDCHGCAGVTHFDAFARLSLHAAKMTRKEMPKGMGVGLAGWAELWKLGLDTHVPQQKQSLLSAGAQFYNDFWRLETLGGVFFDGSESRGLIDIRLDGGSYYPTTEPSLAFGDPVYTKFRANYQYRFRKHDRPAEHFVGVALDAIQYDWLAFGVESENILYPGAPCVYTVGPRIAIHPKKGFETEAAYLFRYNGRNEVWIRAIVQF